MDIFPALTFDDPQATLETAGGKGLNLVRLTRAGFPVPPGFIVPTAAYRAYVASNDLGKKIHSWLRDLSAEDAPGLEHASQAIRALFSSGKLDDEVTSSIRSAYAALGEGPVAVRSSATAEDLPELSFAGQQDTFLNVVGAPALVKAVVECWSSLWTARAIGYRLRNDIDQAGAALAVVVQQMVQSESSGVLFTANPLTGLRSETVIDAALGLGEALVSGQVEPDHYVVDTLTGAIVGKSLGAKKLSTRSKSGGGVETVDEPAADRPALSDEQILELSGLGQAVAREYGTPQDIEWAFSGGKLYLLQARAITSLFPTPEVSFDPLKVWFSFGAVQGLVGPITPLGWDAIRHIPGSMAKFLGSRLTLDEIDLFGFAGERIWIKISDVIRNPVGIRIVGGALGYVEPSVGQIVKSLAADPRMRAGKGRVRLITVIRLAGFFLPIAARMAVNMLRPERGRAAFDRAIESSLATAQIPPAADRFGRLREVTAFMRDRIANAFPFLLPRFIPIFGPTIAALNLLGEIGGNRELALEVTRAVPNNVTTEMDLGLWQAAATIRADAASAGLFRDTDAAGLARRYLDGTLPAAPQAAIADFMEKYGMRGIAEIDIGQPRWRENPTPVMHTLQSYLGIDPEFAPDVLFKRGEQAALAAVEELAAEARRQPGGWLKERLVRGAARRIRVLMGARESPKFFAIRIMGIARRALMNVGEEFAAAGTIERPDDLVYLKFAELDALARNEGRDWKALIAERRAVHAREARRRQVPRVLVSDGRAFYEGLGSEAAIGEAITGSPVSPGVVEGAVRVIFNPNESQLAPGEILVCPGTDPAWTPLFLTAGGLITEVGGMMTHGSVVAREYGIPAVVGVHQATQRLKNGQRIRLDGTSGRIIILD